MIAPRALAGSLVTRWPPPALPKRTLAILAAIGATMIWGSSAVATKAALTDLPPMTIAFMRVAIAYLVLRPLVARAGSRPAHGPLPAILGITGLAGFVLLRNLGLGAAPASHGSLIEGGTTPALAMVLGVMLLAERPSRRHLVGMLASLIGVSVAVLPGMEGGLDVSLVADGMLLAGTACFALYTVLNRRACVAGGSLTIVAGAMRYGLLALAPVAAAELLATGIPSPTPTAVCALLYLGAGCSAGAYALWGYGLSHLPAGQMALFSNLQLVCGMALAAGMAGEVFIPLQLAGATLVLAGIWFGTTTVTAPRSVLWRRARMLRAAASGTTKKAGRWAPRAVRSARSEAVRPFSSGGVVVSYLMRNGREDWVRAAWGHAVR